MRALTTANGDADSPCVLSAEEMSVIIGQAVTETSGQGNWGIASTCTYTTAKAPVAVEIASAASSDLSGDRMYDGVRDVPGLGDEAVWVAATGRLTVVDKNRNRLLRIGIGLTMSRDRKLEVATAVARAALLKP